MIIAIFSARAIGHMASMAAHKAEASPGATWNWQAPRHVLMKLRGGVRGGVVGLGVWGQGFGM